MKSRRTVGESLQQSPGLTTTITIHDSAVVFLAFSLGVSAMTRSVPMMCSFFSLLMILSPGWADEPLRYKFMPGTTLKYVMTQGMKMQMELPAPAPSTTVTTQQLMWMDLITDDVDSAGAAKQRHVITRAQITSDSTGAQSQSSRYDSDDKEASPGPVSAMLKKTMEPMIGKAFSVAMNPRGEVGDIIAPAGFLDGLKGNPAAAMMGELGTEAGIKKLTTQAMIIFPESALVTGQTLETPLEVKMPFGTMKTTRVMTYAGPQDGMLERFSLTTKTKFVPLENSPVKIEIVNEDSMGEILFDRGQGRLDSSRLQQTLEMKLTVGPQTIQQTVVNDVSFILQK
jgi:hypothetical protein